MSFINLWCISVIRATVWLSTAPTQPLTHWYQVRCLLPVPIFVKQGQTLSGKVHLRSNKRFVHFVNFVSVVFVYYICKHSNGRIIHFETETETALAHLALTWAILYRINSTLPHRSCQLIVTVALHRFRSHTILY